MQESDLMSGLMGGHFVYCDTVTGMMSRSGVRECNVVTVSECNNSHVLFAVYVFVCLCLCV